MAYLSSSERRSEGAVALELSKTWMTLLSLVLHDA